MVAMPLAARQRLRELLIRFAADTRGLSAIEFGMILPLMLALYIGSIEVGSGMSVKRKVTHVTSALSDLVTQTEQITNAEMTNILDIAQSVIDPYPQENLRIKIAGVEIDGQGVARVEWSDARNDSPWGVGQIISIPEGLQLPNSYLVTAEVHYAYSPPIGYMLTGGDVDLNDQFYLRPRISSEIDRVD